LSCITKLTQHFALDKRGNRALIGVCSMNICLYIFVYFFYRIINSRRAKKWNSMTPKVRDVFLPCCRIILMYTQGATRVPRHHHRLGESEAELPFCILSETVPLAGRLLCNVPAWTEWQEVKYLHTLKLFDDSLVVLDRNLASHSHTVSL
jgi:hypothetical protein